VQAVAVVVALERLADSVGEGTRVEASPALCGLSRLHDGEAKHGWSLGLLPGVCRSRAPVEEFSADTGMSLYPCAVCGRKFAPVRWLLRVL
jgi:hypothetical protein